MKEKSDLYNFNTRKKFSNIIEKLLIMNGSNGEKCSNRHLALIIDPESPPQNAVADWRRGERLPYGKHLARIAQLLNMSLKELKIYLEIDDLEDYSINLYSQSDLDKCIKFLSGLAKGNAFSEEEAEEVMEILRNLDVGRLSTIYEKTDSEIKILINSIKDPTLIFMYQMHSLISLELIKKLNVLTELERISR